MQFVDLPACTPTQGTCERCGFVASNALCKACVLLEALNKGKPKLAVGKARDQRQLANIPEVSRTNVSCSEKDPNKNCKCASAAENGSGDLGLSKENYEQNSTVKMQSIDF